MQAMRQEHAQVGIHCSTISQMNCTSRIVLMMQVYPAAAKVQHRFRSRWQGGGDQGHSAQQQPCQISHRPSTAEQSTGHLQRLPCLLSVMLSEPRCPLERLRVLHKAERLRNVSMTLKFASNHLAEPALSAKLLPGVQHWGGGQSELQICAS